MIDVATLSVIRRWALREQLSIREIARCTGLSRNTIRKYLRSGEAEPHYAKRVSPSKLDPFALKLAGWLKTEAGRSRKQRRTIKQMYVDLQALGYGGSYNRVAAFARLWHEQRLVAQQTTGRGTFVPLTFGPGEAFQFDWSEDWAVLAGVRTKLQVAHFKLSHSRAFYLRAYPLQTHEMLFDAHNHAFVVLGGVPRRGIYDNMRTAVDRVRRGKERDVKRVSPTCLIHFERNRYSVPAPYANRPVSLRVYADRLVVAAEGQIVCEHQRLIERNHHGAGQTVYDWRHYLAVLQRKPGALRNGAPFLELPAAFKRLQAALLKQPGGDREMVEVLALVLHHDEQAVLAAVELALESGAASKTHILNVLHRLLDGKPAPAPVTSPQALKLSVEPQANVLRYDQLREVRYAS